MRSNELIPTGPDETLDILCGEALKIIQKKGGYRFSIDAILLANFINLKKGERLLDIGSGCGIIPIYLSKKGYSNHMLGVEVQKDLFDVSLKNRKLNNCENTDFVNEDIRTYGPKLRETAFHTIVSNPPYTNEKRGRKSPYLSRDIARHDSLLGLGDLLLISSSLLSKMGRLYLIYPSRRIGEVIHGAKSNRLEAKRLRFIHSTEHAESNLALMEFSKDGGTGAKIEKPLYIYRDGNYADEVATYYKLKD
jgi:tRNA1Val (adenine37-N6)-methyltransferase